MKAQAENKLKYSTFFDGIKEWRSTADHGKVIPIGPSIKKIHNEEKKKGNSPTKGGSRPTKGHYEILAVLCNHQDSIFVSSSSASQFKLLLKSIFIFYDAEQREGVVVESVDFFHFYLSRREGSSILHKY